MARAAWQELQRTPDGRPISRHLSVAGVSLLRSIVVTMIRFAPRQRAALSETLRELANLAAAALVLGQFVGQRALSWQVLVSGAALWLVLVSYALVLEGDR
jgi:hypothetical protein